MNYTILPVRAVYTKPDMFRDRPPRPGMKKEFRWVKQGDQEYEGMKKLKNLAKRQEAENISLIKEANGVLLPQQPACLQWLRLILADHVYLDASAALQLPGSAVFSVGIKEQPT